MKKLLYTILAAVLGLCAASCWKENIPEAGVARHQVTDLKAVPGDEEVQLTWSVPEGWNPTEYIVAYTSGTKVTKHVTEKSCLVDGLKNGENYEFTVQAVYGDAISNPVKAAAKPTTSRLPVKDLTAEGMDGAVVLAWTKPSMDVASYTITYYMEGAEGEKKEISVGADETTTEVTGLTNDKNYIFSIVANYAKGVSAPVSVTALPTLAIPYFVDLTNVPSGYPVTYTFNREDYAHASDVKWTSPDGKILEGDVVKYGIYAVGAQKVILSANINGKVKEWSLEITVRDYAVKYNEWLQNGTSYNGFKGTCPVFSPDGKTVYIITFSKKTCLYAFDIISGALNWVYEPASAAGSYNMLTVNPVSGDIYFGTTTAGQFYCVSPDGNLRWQFKDAGNMQSTAPAVNAAGTEVYLCDYVKDANVSLYAVDAKSGTKLWRVQNVPIAKGEGVCGLLVKGNIVAAGIGKTVKFYKTSDGSEIKSIKFGASVVGNSGFAVAADKNTVYVPLAKGLGSFDFDRQEVIVENFEFSGNNVYEPVVAPNGSVFVGAKDSKVYNVKGDLSTVNWSHSHMDAANAYNFSHPCVDSENHFYITSGQVNNTTYIFNEDGTVKESWSYGGSNNQKQMAGNNYIDGILFSCFVGAADDNGYFYGQYVGGNRASGWSSHGGDICGTCCIK